LLAILTAAVAGFFAGPSSLSAQSSAASGQHSNVLRGTVINRLTREPIGRALVYSPDNRFAAMTDDRGQFEFSFPAPEPQPGGAFPASGIQYIMPQGPTSLLARKPGYLFDENSGQGIAVTPGQPALTIPLMPESLVLGRVLLPTSDYLDRIQVELYRRQIRQGHEHWDSAGSARSRADGTFRFAGLAPGAYKLVTHELLDRDPLTFDPQGQLFGYPPVYYPSAPDFAAAEVIQLAAGTTFQVNLSPDRREYHRVKVRVANALSGLQLQVWPQGRPGPGYSLAYNPEDEAIEGSLPDGTFTIRASAFGPATTTGTTNLTVRGGPATGATMTLLPNASIIVALHEEFQSAATLDYVKSFTSGEPQSGRRPNFLNVNLVPLEEFGYTPGATLRPDTGPEDESLVIENVHPGEYRVEVNSPVGYVASLTSGGTDLLRKPLVVSPGSVPPPIEITLRDDGATVEGTVEGIEAAERFKPAAVYFLPLADGGGRFRIAWIGYSQSNQVTTATFRAEQLAPGGYRVLALDHQAPELEYATEEELAKYESKTQALHVDAGQKTRIQLSLIGRSE
jgi:hypothetical protein